ncbi:hypothetical protein HII31_03313 [Pseudocercospora fuligena]|uniref:BTB domain-containing protein n=1 Tax=Pseudocercospora fuligena TaxID=685502 RepID=A0A8H6RN60_9PEZI|nr:hypothetical protein HII31_03313 [Pseudocercospora fuligena]
MADADTRAAKRRRFTSPLVTIKVGADAESFTIHQADLAEHSPFFKAALDAKWREGQTREISLPEDEPDVVVIYLDWLSSKDVPLFLSESKTPDYTLLFKVYIFGDKVKDDAFCDRVLSMVCRGLDLKDAKGDVRSPAPSKLKFLYDRTLPSCPLRALIAQAYADRCEETWFDDSDGKSYSDCPKDFFFDMTKAFIKLRGESEVAGWYDRREQFFKQKPQL